MGALEIFFIKILMFANNVMIFSILGFSKIGKNLVVPLCLHASRSEYPRNHWQYAHGEAQ